MPGFLRIKQGYKVLRSDIFSSLVKDALDDEVVKALDDEVADDGSKY